MRISQSNSSALSRCCSVSKREGRRALRVACSENVSHSVSRRQAFLLATSTASIAAAQFLASRAAFGATAAAVGNYLPPAGIDDLVLFKPDAQRTPALRAGVIKPETPYSFAMAPSFKEAKISNTISGNFCMPNCGEPWTEVIYDSDTDGKVQLLAANMVKLTNKKNATVLDLGAPSALLERVGPNITGTYYDEYDVVETKTKVQDDGRTYYYNELNAPGASNGPHNLSACVTKDEVLYIFVVSASDKQWSRSQKKLREMVESFRA